jgi:hypothetical protein
MDPKKGGEAWNVFMWPRIGDLWIALANHILNLAQITENNFESIHPAVF